MKTIKRGITIIALTFTLFMGGAAPVIPNTTVAHAKNYIRLDCSKLWH
ncbi:hypothetical protein [Levilactobacillus brevis]|nr:hypothetical protein [Levilactobacillus brevis]